MAAESKTERERQDVIIVGAGLSGVAMAVQLQRKCSFSDFEIYDEQGEIGGAWARNTYPGLGCDINAHAYSFSFAPNPNWSTNFASQPEILSYIQSVASTHGLPARTRLRHRCVDAHWDDTAKRWEVGFLNLETKERVRRTCKVLVYSVAKLNVPRVLEDVLPGSLSQQYTGKHFHSAQWDDAVELRGKDVVCVGNGASAAQIVPYLVRQAQATSVTQIVRSKHWMIPKERVPYSKGFKWAMRNIPFLHRFYTLLFSLQVELLCCAIWTSTVSTKIRRFAETEFGEYMRSKVPRKFQDAVIPTYSFGAKRPVFDEGYLDCFKTDNFQISDKRITGVEGKVIIDETGERHKADVLILANGFATQDPLAGTRICGLGGVELSVYWESVGGPQAYMGTTVTGFPNFFLLGGPNILTPGNSISGIELAITYILRVTQGILRGDLNSVVPRPEAEEEYNAKLRARMRQTISGEVNSWIVNEKSGKNTVIWPGFLTELWFFMSVAPVKWNHFVVSRN